MQIGLEALYSLAIFIIAGLHLVVIGASARHIAPAWECWMLKLFRATPPPRAEGIALWSVVFFSGMIGSNVLVTKWLYHSVAASWSWNQDRILWRVFVPIQGGVLAVFVGFMSLGGLLSTEHAGILGRYATAAGFGFFFGLLADNVISSLQKLIRAVLHQIVRATTRALGQDDSRTT